MPLTPLRLAALLAVLSCAAPSAARADRFERLSKDPKLTRVLLVPQSDLARHDLPATQRSRLHVALRGDILAYYDFTATYFLGVGTPLLSYGDLRWRSLTLWFNSDYGAQLETAASFVVFKPQATPGALAVGLHLGTQEMKTYSDESKSSQYEYDEYGYYYNASYTETRVSPIYYGPSVHYEFQSAWVGLSLDFSLVSRTYYGYDLAESEDMEITRLGLNMGVAF